MQKTIPYYILLVLALLAVCVVPLAMPHGGVTSDAVYYFRIADQIPEVNWSLFPWGFPVVLKTINVITNDWFWAGRVTSVLIYLSIILFSYVQKFHFRETVILLMTKIFFYSLFNIISEGLFLALMYFQFYFLYEYFRGGRTGFKFYVPAAVLMALMFTVRYSAVYLFVGMVAFYGYYRTRHKTAFQNRDFLYFLILSALGIAAYMLFNFTNYGDFAGERYRNLPPADLTDNLGRNVLSVFNSFNPVLGVKLHGSSTIVMVAETVFLLINMVFIFIAINVWRSYFRHHRGLFHKMLITTGLVYTVLVFASFYRQGIEELNIRMLAESTFCYLFSLVFILFKQRKHLKIIYTLAVFSLVFNSLYVLKVPENYLQRKAEVEEVFSEMNGKRYYFIDDLANVRVESYRVPFIKKEIKYEHSNMNDAMINGSIIMAKDPRVFWILKDTVQDKSMMVYSSELRRRWEIVKKKNAASAE